MLVIRQQQLHLFGLECLLPLEPVLMRKFAEDYPVDFVSLGDDAAVAFIRATLSSAIDRNVKTEAAISGLLRLYIEFGPGLERAPYRSWANSLLDHPTIPGILKVNIVGKRLFGLTQGRRMILHRDDA